VIFFFRLILLKIAIIKGAIIGGLIGGAIGRRGRRDADNEATKALLVSASQQDEDDCAKKLVSYKRIRFERISMDLFVSRCAMQTV